MKKAIKKLEDLMEIGGIRKDILLLVISGVSIICSLLHVQPFPFDLAWFAVILCGFPIILEAIIGLVTAFDIKADVLVSLALIASICIGETFAAGEVAFIMQLGALLEELTVAKARAGIEKLVHLTPQIARVLQMDKEVIVPAEQVRIGDRIRVLPGETIPVDGIIVSGQTSINQAVMTGESLPVDKAVGDEVSSGTVNQFGTFEMEATRVGEDSSIQRMIKLVQSADAGKAKIVGIADRWATWIVVIALSAAVITWLVTGQIIRAVTILVVFCPCALVLATPTAIMAAIGNATKHGFLVRQGDALERLANTKIIAFDKTGTLTYGTPRVIAVQSVADVLTTKELYQMVASAERFSEHPFGKAVVQCFKKEKTDFTEVDNFQIIPGRGVYAEIEGKRVLAGNPELLTAHHVEIPVLEDTKDYIRQGCTIIYVSVNNTFAGFLALSYTVRKESEHMIDELLKLGICPVLLTGDHENAANTIASLLHIEDVKANCMPENKLAYIEKYQKNGMPVCMIGDGINDAPALKKADVGIAMGGIGSDAAIEAADIVIMNDELSKLPIAIKYARMTMKTVKENVWFALGVKAIVLILAALGYANMWLAVFADVGVALLAILNATKVMRK